MADYRKVPPRNKRWRRYWPLTWQDCVGCDRQWRRGWGLARRNLDGSRGHHKRCPECTRRLGDAEPTGPKRPELLSRNNGVGFGMAPSPPFTMAQFKRLQGE